MNINNPNQMTTPPPYFGTRTVAEQTNAVLKRGLCTNVYRIANICILCFGSCLFTGSDEFHFREQNSLLRNVYRNDSNGMDTSFTFA